MKKSKTKRTQLNDLAMNEQELSGKEMAQVQGGAASNLNSSKSNLPAAPAAPTAAIIGAIAPPPPTGTALKAGEEPKKDKQR